MKTRTADPNAPLSQERYMSGKEYSELRGVSGVAVAARAAVTMPGWKQNLIWWLQAMSLREGGLRKLTEDLIAAFPDQLAGAGTKDRKRLEISKRAARCGDHFENFSGQNLGEQSIEEFLTDLCINPRIHIRTEADGSRFDDIEADMVKQRFSDLENDEFKPAELSYFKDIVGTLIEFKRRHEQAAKENFEQTAISRKIWETLDFALKTKNMVLLDGLEGRGKTEAVKAWCELHLDAARFVSLKGITSKTTAFREIAKALGIASSYSRTATEMQARIEDVLARSKLMLVIDEAHFVFNQSARIYNRPELVDWIDTAICNRKIPIALCSTPQFMVCMTRAAKQVDWNYRQFRRRVRRYVKLPAKNTPADIENVARRMLPGAPASALKLVLGYAMLSKRDLSAIGDVVDEIKAMQGGDTISKVTFEQIREAIEQHLMPSDQAFAEALKATEKTGRNRQTKTEKFFVRDTAPDGSQDSEFGAERVNGTRTAGAPLEPVWGNRDAILIDG